MRLHLRTATTLLALTLTTAALAQTTLLALSKRDHTLSVIDPTSLKILYTLPVGPDPHEVIASTDGTTAYVSNYGGGQYHTLAVLDLVHHKALPTIDLGPLYGPHGLTFAGGKLYFYRRRRQSHRPYLRPRLPQSRLDLRHRPERHPHGLRTLPDLQHIVTSNVASATVSLIDMQEPSSAWAHPQTCIPPPECKRLPALPPREKTGPKP